jgi:hypothetical protein
LLANKAELMDKFDCDKIAVAYLKPLTRWYLILLSF